MSAVGIAAAVIGVAGGVALMRATFHGDVHAIRVLLYRLSPLSRMAAGADSKGQIMVAKCG